MAKRTLPRILERPIHYSGDADLRATLSERWRVLCEAEGIHLSRPIYDLNGETLLDAIAREPSAARAMLAALASRYIACFRDAASPRKKRGTPRQTAAHYVIAERFVELERAHSGKTEMQLCKMLLDAMKKDDPALLKSARIESQEGIRSAVRIGIQRHAEFLEMFERVAAVRKRRSMQSLLSDRPPDRSSMRGFVGVEIIPKPPLMKRSRRKKDRL